MTRPGSGRLLRRFERGCGLFPLCRLDRGGLLLDPLNQVINDIGILQPVVGNSADIDLMGVVAAAGEADIGLARAI